MTKEEMLQALQVLDNFLCEEDEESNENDSQLWIKYSNIAVFLHFQSFWATLTYLVDNHTTQSLLSDLKAVSCKNWKMVVKEC